MKKVCYQQNIEIPVIADVDVLVVGGGPGGLGAAVMSARNGAKTLLVERYGCLGGMAFHGEVSPFMANHANGKALDRPVFLEWCRQMEKYRTEKELENYPQNMEYRLFPLVKEDAMLAMEDLILESGANILYHHTLADVIMEDGKIKYAIFNSKSGLAAIESKVFIDSTGDGDLAVLSGCKQEFGNEDGYCQPMTTCFKLSHVDKDRMPERSEINRLYDEAKNRGEINCLRENVLMFYTLENDVIHFNTTRIVKKSGVNALDLSEAEIEGRKQIREYLAFFRKYVSGFEEARIHSIASHVGIRESRRIRGITYQTKEDFFQRAKYPDSIVRCNYMIDIHNPSGTGTEIQRIDGNDWYEIRYGAIVPEGSKNLLMACRAISVDHALHSSIRVMPPVCSIGQAAGVAAAYSVKENIPVSEISGEIIHNELKAVGAFD